MDEAPRETPTQGVYAGPITDLQGLVASAADRGALEGREVAIDGVVVQSVLGPDAF